MITTVRIHSGFAAELPCLKGKEFKFEPGLNIVFGPNGCGKTSLMKIIAGYCCVQNEGGWSKRPDSYNINEKSQFPKALVGQVVGNCVADVAWDGTATFLNQSAQSDVQMPGCFETSDPTQSIDGITTMNDQLSMMMGKLSTGQVRLMKFARIVETMKAPPLTWALARRAKDESVKKDSFLKYIRSLPRKGPMTILLDEPDKGLDLKHRALLWQNAMLKLVELGFQVIVTTHCLLAFIKYNNQSKRAAPSGANFIDLNPEYMNDSIIEMAMLSGNPAGFLELVMRVPSAAAKKPPEYDEDYSI